MFVATLGLGQALAQDVECTLDFDVHYGCVAADNGWAAVMDVVNATPPITISWSNGWPNQYQDGLADGVYSVTVSDANNCAMTKEVEIACSKKEDEDEDDKDDEPKEENCQFRTQTMGGWGAPPNGNNPASYLHANFAAAFPDGITIGCTRTLTLTSAQAVRNFLPSGTAPKMLPVGALVNPGQSYKNVLAGQLVAATISVGFDLYDPNFGESDGNLADAVFATGLFEGWSVADVLMEANNFIGGCGSDYTAGQLNAALDMLNNNYVDGTTDNGNFICGEDDKKDEEFEDKSFRMADIGSLSIFPNPANDLLQVDLVAGGQQRVVISMMDLSGRKVMADMMLNMELGDMRREVIKVDHLMSGIYLLAVQRNGNAYVQKVVVSH